MNITGALAANPVRAEEFLVQPAQVEHRGDV